MVPTKPLNIRSSMRDFSLEDLVKWCAENELNAFRAKQLFNQLHKRRYNSFEQMTVLPIALRNWLNENMVLSPFIHYEVLTSNDNSKKIVYTLPTQKKIETVWLPEHYGNTICISTQTGCAGKCVFCQTGKLKGVENLSVAEIVSQVYDTELIVGAEATHLVVMGMGEPLLNIKNVLKALEILVDSEGHNLSKRKITLSTVGILSGLEKLIEARPGYNLSLSLHFTDESLRQIFMPLTVSHPLDLVLTEIENYRLITDCKVSIEYIMFAGVNDHKHDAINLAKMLRNYRWHINLLEYNPIGFVLNPITQKPLIATNREKIIQFQNLLKSKGFEVNIRTSRGVDIGAACGQLGKINKSRTN